jgi:hypothetical protein
MKFKTSIAAIVAITTIIAGTVSSVAQSDGDLAKARDILAITKLTSRYDLILPNLAERTKRLYIRANPSVEKDVAEATDEIALGFVGRRVEFENEVAAIWVKNFSSEELDVIHAFYTSAAGKKMLETTPVLARETLRAADAWGEALSQDLIVAVREELKARGLDF